MPFGVALSRLTQRESVMFHLDAEQYALNEELNLELTANAVKEDAEVVCKIVLARQERKEQIAAAEATLLRVQRKAQIAANAREAKIQALKLKAETLTQEEVSRVNTLLEEPSATAQVVEAFKQVASCESTTLKILLAPVLLALVMLLIVLWVVAIFSVIPYIASLFSNATKQLEIASEDLLKDAEASRDARK